MSIRIGCLTMAALLLVSGNALAAESKGEYFQYTISSTETTLADGRTVAVSRNYQFTTSDQPDDPLHKAAGECLGRAVLSKEGKLISNSGACLFKTSDGDGFSFAWKMEQAGTADCPNQCGSFSYTDGYGKFAGISGGGEWVYTHDFTDGGGAGTFTSTYKK
jgi:hypothetical protein